MIDASPRDSDTIQDGPRTVTLGLPPAPGHADLIDAARACLAARRRRTAIFALTVEIFHEPAWDILLDLFIAQGEDRHPDFAAMCANAGVQGPTALRWITSLEQLDLVQAHADPTTDRPVLRLTAHGLEAMETYLSGI